MIIQKRTMSWLPRPSAYQQMQAQHAKMAARQASLSSDSTSFMDAFSNVQSNLLVETGKIVTNIAVARITGKTA